MLDETRKTKAVLYAGIILFLLWALVPYLWMIRASFLTPLAAIQRNIPIIPTSPEVITLKSYIRMWGTYDFPVYFKNSIIVAFAATLIATTVSVPGAYAYARLDFPGRKYLFYATIITVMFPWIVLTIPVYALFYTVGLIDTLTGVIIALAIFVMPQTIWLLQGFFRQGLPSNIENAAKLDGCSEITAFIRIVLPLSLPAISAAAMFAFLGSWNSFLWVYILTSDSSDWTVTVAINRILASDILKQWNLVMAGATLLVLPPVLFYAISQRYVGEGLGGGIN